MPVFLNVLHRRAGEVLFETGGLASVMELKLVTSGRVTRHGLIYGKETYSDGV